MAEKKTPRAMDTFNFGEIVPLWSDMIQLKPKEIACVRLRMLKEQKYKCPLCGNRIRKNDAALDHDHDTGRVRAVLHRNCNSIEGRIKHWARRSGVNHADFVNAVTRYWAVDYSHNPVHCSHRTDNQKRATVLRRRIRKAKRASTKERLRKEIKELLNGQD